MEKDYIDLKVFFLLVSIILTFLGTYLVGFAARKILERRSLTIQEEKAFKPIEPHDTLGIDRLNCYKIIRAVGLGLAFFSGFFSFFFSFFLLAQF
jgi:hypothetical protein